MNFSWWLIWMVMIVWIFAMPYDIPGQRRKKNSPLDILQKRFASGEITTEEYQEKKNTLENDSANTKKNSLKMEIKSKSILIHSTSGKTICSGR